MRTGIALSVATVFVLALAGCAGSGTTIPGFAGAGTAATTQAPSVDATTDATPEPTTPAASGSAGASSTPSASATVSGDTDCGGQAVTLTTATLSYTLTGDCPSVTVEGDGITVNGPAVAALEIKGSSNVITLSSVGPVTIGGQDNSVAAQTVDTFAITGDRNRIDSASTVTGGSFAGNENQVHAPSGIGTVTDTGAGNTAGA